MSLSLNEITYPQTNRMVGNHSIGLSCNLLPLSIVIIVMNNKLQQILDQQKSIILFDGVCNLCNGLVQFVLPRDRNKQFHFAALQSKTGTTLQKQFGFDPNDLNTFIIIQKDKVLTRSSAALFLLQNLGGLWSLMRVFWIIPRPLRDAVYNFISKNRYRWFGKQESCMLPQPQWMERFV